jgi:hypothetical protein
MRRILQFFLVFILFVAATFVNINSVEAQSSDQYVLELQGFVWNHDKLRALIVTAENESWWNPSYVDIALRAIGQWNDALTGFAANYSDYSYLSNVQMRPTVSNASQVGFDIYINWTDSPLSSTSDEVGLSRLSVDKKGVIVNCSVNLAIMVTH